MSEAILGFLLLASLAGHLYQSRQIATLARTILGSQRFLAVGTEEAIEQTLMERQIETDRQVKAIENTIDPAEYLRRVEEEILTGKRQ